MPFLALMAWVPIWVVYQSRHQLHGTCVHKHSRRAFKGSSPFIRPMWRQSAGGKLNGKTIQRQQKCPRASGPPPLPRSLQRRQCQGARMKSSTRASINPISVSYGAIPYTGRGKMRKRVRLMTRVLRASICQIRREVPLVRG